MIQPAELADIGQSLETLTGTVGDLARALRERYPHLSFSVCDASDVQEDPIAQTGRFDLHLIDARVHCLRLTQQFEQATGVLLAARRLH